MKPNNRRRIDILIVGLSARRKKKKKKKTVDGDRRTPGVVGGSAVVWRERDESPVQRTMSRPIFIHASHVANRQAINHRIMETLPAVYALAIIHK